MLRTLAIVGGGLQGMMLCRHLQQEYGWTTDELCLIDPRSLGFWWRERVHDCDTAHLRSGPYDHVDNARKSLLDFAARNGRLERGFATDARRPCVKLFNEHLAAVAAEISAYQLIGRAETLSVRGDQTVELGTSAGTIEARNVVLATGPGVPNYPDWAEPYRNEPWMTHIFERNFERATLPAGTRIALIGGGISAVQVALALRAEGHDVCLYTRRALGVRSASNPADWTADGLLGQLHTLPYEVRSHMLATHGDKGTLPAWESERLHTALTEGKLRHRVCQIQRCESGEKCPVLYTDGEPIECDIVVLSTGFDRSLPQWLRRAAQLNDLPLTRRGEPVLSKTLQWGRNSGIYVMGGFAAPILGPYADNMFGGRAAVEILSAVFAKSRKPAEST